jgi:mono/diheme cytochrome c family protein
VVRGLNLKTPQLTIAAICLLLASAAGLAQGPDSNLTSNPVYEKNCAKCHGENAEGRHFHGPSLKSEKVASASVDYLNKIITSGKGHMPKFNGKLTPEEIDTVVQQIEAANKK